MTELSRFQKDVEVAATALEMRAENEDAKEEAIHLYRKFGSTKQEPLRLAVALRGYFLEEGVEEEERAHYGAYLKKRIRPAVERLILEDDWEKIEKLYENEWFGEQELEVFLKLAEEWRRPAALMGLLHLKKQIMDLKRKNSSCDFFFRKSGKEAFGGPEAGRAWNTYPGKYKERAVLLFSISGRCLCLYFREGIRADRNHWNRRSFLPFFPGISAGALCKKAGGSTKRLSAHAAALPVSASFSGRPGGQTLMEPGL